MQALLPIIILITLTVGCGTQSGEHAAATAAPGGNVSGVIDLGPSRNASLRVFRFTGAEGEGELLAIGHSDAQGRYSINLYTPSGPIMVEAGEGSYIEEVDGANVAMPRDQPLFAVINYMEGTNNTAHLTHWTTLATALAHYLSRTGSTASQALQEANREIDAIVGLPVVTSRPESPGFTNGATGTTLSTEKTHGLLVAAVSQLTTTLNSGRSDPGQLVSSLAFTRYAYDDLQFDGVLNGRGSSTTILPDGITVSTDLYRHGLAVSLLKYAQSNANHSGIDAAMLVTLALRLNNSGSPIYGNATLIALDENGPVITQLSPAADTTIYGQYRCAVTVNDVIGLASVDFLVDESYAGSAANPSAATFTLDADSYAEGPHTLTARATNLVGTTVQVTHGIVITSSATALSITQPAPDSFLGGSVTVSTVASGVPPLRSVELYVDNTRVAGTAGNATAQFTFDSTRFPDGRHRLWVTGTNAADRTFSAEIPMTLDNTAPELTATAPAPGSYHGGMLTVSATASDVNLDRILFGIDDLPPRPAGDVANAARVIDTATFNDGAHRIAVEVVDKAGNSRNGQFSLYFDNTAPRISNIFPPDGTVVGTEQFTVMATIEELSLASVEFWLDGNFYINGGLQAQTFIVGSRLSPGTHIITVLATDSVGNFSARDSSVVRR